MKKNCRIKAAISFTTDGARWRQDLMCYDAFSFLFRPITMLRVASIFLLLTALISCSPKQSGTAQDAASAGASTGFTTEEKSVTSDGLAWLAENAKQEGIVVTDSGLQYMVIDSGDGATPGSTDTVLTHYHGTFIGGEVFDSSVDRGKPLEFQVNRVISGWSEALQLMQEGDKWKLFVPPKLGYGDRGTGAIPGNTVLIFEVTLLKVGKG